MGVKDLAAYVKKNLPELIKQYPQRWHSPELKGKKIGLDGSLLLNRLYFAGQADIDVDPKRMVIGWHDLITKMRAGGTIPIAIWDQPGTRAWKAVENKRRKTARELSLSRAIHEEERRKRLEDLAGWLQKAKSLTVREMEQVAEIYKEGEVLEEVEKVGKEVGFGPMSDKKLEAIEGDQEKEAQDSIEEIGNDTASLSDKSAPDDPLPFAAKLAHDLRNLESEVTSSHRPYVHPGKRSLAEIETTVFVDELEGKEKDMPQEEEHFEVEEGTLAIEPEKEWRETRRQSGLTQGEMLLIEDIGKQISTLSPDQKTQSVMDLTKYTSLLDLKEDIGSSLSSIAATKETSSGIDLSVHESLLDVFMQEGIKIAKTHDRAMSLPSREDHEESQGILRAMGVPVVIAQIPFEAEGIASHMAKAGLIDYVATEDSDVLAYGAPMIRYATESRKPLSIVSGEDVRLALELDESIYLDFMILCGTDASTRIPNIGPVKALKHLRQYGSIEKILHAQPKLIALLENGMDDFLDRADAARGVFSIPPPLPTAEELVPTQISKNDIKAFMAERHGVIVPDEPSAEITGMRDGLRWAASEGPRYGTRGWAEQAGFKTMEAPPLPSMDEAELADMVAREATLD